MSSDSERSEPALDWSEPEDSPRKEYETDSDERRERQREKEEAAQRKREQQKERRQKIAAERKAAAAAQAGQASSDAPAPAKRTRGAANVDLTSLSKEAAKKPRKAVRKVKGKKIATTGKVLPRGTLTIDDPDVAPAADEATYDQFLLDEIDKIAARIDATSDEAEKKKLKELHIAKSLQLSDKAKPISVAILEVTPED